MSSHTNAISNRMSLRTPQQESLEILERVCELIPLTKDIDLEGSLEALKGEFPLLEDFERDFPSLCFALATGVGKTRLMGAFITYLFRVEKIRHFFVLAPNLTIYDKLLTDFTPNTSKYVFQGIAEFATDPPILITGDNYESGIGVRDELSKQQRIFDAGEVHINIFNVSKITSEIRGGKAPRIKRLSEYIGESYFEYLSKLDDLVLLMDESHRYRASAGVKAINELKPILGLELTATPRIERGNNSVFFKNVVYNYPLSAALTDGYVKEPAVGTRENFDARNYKGNDDGLEKLKLEDGIRFHEDTKVALEVYARENDQKIVKPFMLVVAQDTTHANALKEVIEDDSFFEGRYRGKVITVHSKKKGEERDEVVEQLLSVEDPRNPVEIVVHVNMLKEGWDVTNLYTIVPLRTANSKTLVEQSVGRGLRLPYGKRTGVGPVDRLTIVSHDRFQDIINEAHSPDSVIRTGVVIGREVPDESMKAITVKSLAEEEIVGSDDRDGGAQTTLFSTPQERETARCVYEVLKQYERLPRSGDLEKPEVQEEIAERVEALLTPAQREIQETGEAVDVKGVVRDVTSTYVKRSIDIPKIVVVPTGDVRCYFEDFDLDVSGINLQPVAKELVSHGLHSGELYRLNEGDGVVVEERLEDYLVRGLVDYNDINYDETAPLLYKLARQVVKRLQSYLDSEEDVLNVLQYHQKVLVELIYAQMQKHYVESATAYEASMCKGFSVLRSNTYAVPEGESIRNFREPVRDPTRIKRMIFGGFGKCLYRVQKFDSDTERRFAVVLELDEDVLKWVKPGSKDFRIGYRQESTYEPDFVVEAKDAMYLCEPKRASELQSGDVVDKANAAATWCKHATEYAQSNGGKPWTYLLIPHDTIAENKTLKGLAASCTYRND